MIHFEVIQCPNPNAQTTFKFLKNEVYVGKDKGDLSLGDPALESSHLLIEVPEQDLLVHPQKNVEYYLLNGKRTTSIRKLKVGDTLTIGKTIIKVLGFERTEYPSRKDILNSKLAKLMEEGSPRLSVIEKITKLMR